MLDEYSDLLTINEQCEILQIGHNTAYSLLNNGFIAAFRIGRRWKIPKTALAAHLNLNRQGGLHNDR